MKIKPIQATEHQIQNLLIHYLRVKGFYVMRLNSGAIRVDKRLIRMAEKGTPDMLAFRELISLVVPPRIVSMKTTNMIFIEVKRPGNKPTFLQKLKMEELERYGAKCIVASSIEDLQKEGV